MALLTAACFPVLDLYPSQASFRPSAYGIYIELSSAADQSIGEYQPLRYFGKDFMCKVLMMARYTGEAR